MLENVVAPVLHVVAVFSGFVRRWRRTDRADPTQALQPFALRRLYGGLDSARRLRHGVRRGVSVR